MAITRNISLTADLLKWALDKVRGGGFNNVSEVVREACRAKRAAEQADYLHPPPLPRGTLERYYARQTKEERAAEERAGRKAHAGLKRVKPEDR